MSEQKPTTITAITIPDRVMREIFERFREWKKKGKPHLR